MKAPSISAARFRLLPLFSAALMLGCRWQSRADNLQHSLNVFVEKGGRLKDDFVRRYGPPLSCAAIPTGELCRWSAGGGVLRVGFDKTETYTGGAAFYRHGRKTYRGKDEPALDDASDVSCGNGEVLEDGQCTAADPVMERPQNSTVRDLDSVRGQPQ